MTPIRIKHIAAALLLLTPSLLEAQGSQLNFDGFYIDGDLPIEVEADQIEVLQSKEADNKRIAELTGDVTIVQGDMKITSDTVIVTFGSDGGEMEKIETYGDMVLTTQDKTVKASKAIYDMLSGKIDLSENVVLIQEGVTIVGKNMVVETFTGKATITGRVRTVLNP